MFSCDFHQHIPGRSHTLSAELCTAPPKDVTCSLQTHGCLTSAYHNTAACRIMGGLNLKPRGAKQTLTSVAPSRWPYRKQSMIYYTVLQKASRSHHARLITGQRSDHMDNKWSLALCSGGWAKDLKHHSGKGSNCYRLLTGHMIFQTIRKHTVTHMLYPDRSFVTTPKFAKHKQ